MTQILLAVICSVASSAAQTVFSSDFDGALPAAVDAGSGQLTPVQGFSGLGPAGNQFGGSFLRSPTANVVKLQLSGLPPHTTVNIGFLLAAIDSLDGEGAFPSGDYFHIKLDGVTLFRESLANAVESEVQTYVPAPGAELARHQDLGFSGPGGYYTDSAYNFAVEPRLREIPHTLSTLTLEYVIEGEGIQDLDDESWAIDNLTVSVASGPLMTYPHLASYKVTFPDGITPRFTCLVQGAVPFFLATLQSSTDLGIIDPWKNLTSTPVNGNGSASFNDVPDFAPNAQSQNFYRIKISGP